MWAPEKSYYETAYFISDFSRKRNIQISTPSLWIPACLYWCVEKWMDPLSPSPVSVCPLVTFVYCTTWNLQPLCHETFLIQRHPGFTMAFSNILIINANHVCSRVYMPPRQLSGQESAYQCRRCGFWSLGWEDPLEEEMETHSSILAWRIPWTEEPGSLYSTWGCKRVEHDWATEHTHTHTLQSIMSMDTLYAKSSQASACIQVLYRAG